MCQLIGGRIRCGSGCYFTAVGGLLDCRVQYVSAQVELRHWITSRPRQTAEIFEEKRVRVVVLDVTETHG
jgi:hypothetical protein